MGSKRSLRYSEEFKRDAVALVRSSGRNVTEVARELGVSAEGLRNWVNKDNAAKSTVDSGLSASEREELKRLRRRVAEQDQTIEVLKKATAFFARESDR